VLFIQAPQDGREQEQDGHGASRALAAQPPRNARCQRRAMVKEGASGAPQDGLARAVMDTGP
jgi:hypothetical protein